MKGSKLINKGSTQHEAGYEALATEIVKYACYEYLDALRKLQYYDTKEAVQDALKRKTISCRKQAKVFIEEEKKKTYGVLKDVENFFYSQWYYELCDVPPNDLIKILHDKFYNHQHRANDEIWKTLRRKKVTTVEICKLLGISSATLYQRLNKELPGEKKKEIIDKINKYAKERDLQ